MRKLFTLLFCVVNILCAYGDDISTVRGLVHRMFPSYEHAFTFKKINSKADVFSLQSKGGKIIISGNNANSMATALNHYMKYYCKVDVGWFKSDAYELPATPPRVPKAITVKARVKDRFFLNYCTYGYTMPWWKWDEWEHFIDWMALNGINLPLAITGQESIWYQVWHEMGLDDKTIRSYFTGPAHLPWHRMINIDRWFGPLPKSWLDGQLELQKRITKREREFNMRPVLPAFAGHVPAELSKIHPEAKITELAPWDEYPKEYSCSFLDPMDPLFPKIQKRFIEIEDSIYGTDHIYGIDLFNEVTPPSYEPDYLRRVSRQVYESLAKADPKSVWLQMTWVFYYRRKNWTNDRIEPFITAFPKEKSLLLDYYCEKKEVWQMTDKFFGVPYIWCYLGNFGGNSKLTGNLSEINKRIENTFANGGKNFSGIGATLEGFDCNPYIYEYVFEKAWDFPTHRNITEWVSKLADQRAGKADRNAREAWQLLVDSIYNTKSASSMKPFVDSRPVFKKKQSKNTYAKIAKENRCLMSAIDKLLLVDSKLSSYQFDLANLTRQMLTNLFLAEFHKYEVAYDKKDREAMRRLEKEMTGIINDMDRVLATQSYFLTGKWIDDARSWGTTPEERLYFEKNARNLVTTWSDKAQWLNDYAARTWAGMVKTFYGKRWQMFFEAVEKAMDEGQDFDEEHYRCYYDQVCTFEKYWWEGCVGKFNATPAGDSKTITRELMQKYRHAIMPM